MFLLRLDTTYMYTDSEIVDLNCKNSFKGNLITNKAANSSLLSSSTSQVSPLDMAVAGKSLSSLHHDPNNILSAINVTAPHASQNFRHIYTQAGTPTSIGLNDPLLSGQQVKPTENKMFFFGT